MAASDHDNKELTLTVLRPSTRPAMMRHSPCAYEGLYIRDFPYSMVPGH
jgi:hypothetical protein